MIPQHIKFLSYAIFCFYDPYKVVGVTDEENIQKNRYSIEKSCKLYDVPIIKYKCTISLICHQ